MLNLAASLRESLSRLGRAFLAWAMEPSMSWVSRRRSKLTLSVNCSTRVSVVSSNTPAMPFRSQFAGPPAMESLEDANTFTLNGLRRNVNDISSAPKRSAATWGRIRPSCCRLLRSHHLTDDSGSCRTLRVATCEPPLTTARCQRATCLRKDSAAAKFVAFRSAKEPPLWTPPAYPVEIHVPRCTGARPLHVPFPRFPATASPSRENGEKISILGEPFL